jgi:hypothetical protein
MSKTSERSENRSSAEKEDWYEAKVRDHEAYLEINKTILDLLKDPVSLSLRSSNRNRRYQR